MSEKGETFLSAGEKARTQSQATQTTCFEYFVADFCKYDAKTAYENFINGYAPSPSENEGPQDATSKILPDQDTRERAEHLIKSLQQHIEDFTKSSLAIKSFEYTKRHEDIITSFFRDLKMKRPFDEVFRNSLQKIQQDPVVSKDQEFIDEFRRQAERIKPKKLREHSFSISGSQGAIFIINVTPGQFKDDQIKSDLLRDTLIESLYGLYQKHLPENEAPNREEIEVDVTGLLVTKRPSIGSSLAFDDVTEISKMAHEEATKAHHETQDLTRNKSFYKFGKEAAQELDDKVRDQLLQFKKSHKLSRTERVDIVRDLIIELNQGSLSSSRKEAIFEKAVKRSQAATPLERLREDGIEVTSPLDPSGKGTLAAIILESKEKILQEPFHTHYAALLQKAYENVKRWDLTQGGTLDHERNGIDFEVNGLMKGVKSASVKEAIFEVSEKRKLYIKAKVFHEELSKVKSLSTDVKNEKSERKQRHKNKIEYEVYGMEENVPKKETSIGSRLN